MTSSGAWSRVENQLVGLVARLPSGFERTQYIGRLGPQLEAATSALAQDPVFIARAARAVLL